MSEQQLNFEVTFGHHNHMRLTITVEKGEIIEVYKDIDHYLHGCTSSHTYTQKNELYEGEFEHEVSRAIHEIFDNQKDTYKKLVESLSSEMLEKYFKPFYIPK